MKRTGQKDYFSIRYCFAGEEEKIPSALDYYAQDLTDLQDVNRVLELYSIKKFFDKYDHVNGWDNEKLKKCKELSQNAENEVRHFFLTITEENIVSVHDECEVMFLDDFWKFFYMYKVYEKIKENHFKDIIEGLHMSPNKLLENKKLVDRFDRQVAEILREPEFGARFIADYYLRKDNGKECYYFPKSFTSVDKYNTVKACINGDIVNANILDLM